MSDNDKTLAHHKLDFISHRLSKLAFDCERKGYLEGAELRRLSSEVLQVSMYVNIVYYKAAQIVEELELNW